MPDTVRPTLCIVAGPNGSGKTSTTIQLLNNEWAEDSIYINPDNIAQERFGDWNSSEAVRLRHPPLGSAASAVIENAVIVVGVLSYARMCKFSCVSRGNRLRKIRGKRVEYQLDAKD